MSIYFTRSIILFFFAISVASGQERLRSLLELAKGQGGTAANSIDLEFPVLNFPQLLGQSDLVLQGRIVEAKTSLKSDESFVVTKYEIAPIRIVKQNNPINPTKPGETNPIVLRLLGGTVVVDGRYHLTTNVPDFPDSDRPKVGEEMIFFMLYSVDERGVVDKKVYNLTNGPFSVFRVRDGHVQALRHAMADHLGDKPVAVAAFLSDLQRKVSK